LERTKEHFNLTMQILCFIMHRSLHNEKSFREDIDQYVVTLISIMKFELYGKQKLINWERLQKETY